MNELPYNRALHPDDYEHPSLAPHVAALRVFEQRLARTGAPYRKDHQHREWEYGQVIRQLVEQGIVPGAGQVVDVESRERGPDRPWAPRILDTGSGASYFPPMLKMLGYDITVSDSMDYGDTTDWLRRQCFGLGIEIPLVIAPVQKLGLESDQWDVTMCISVIEHVAVDQFAAGLCELVRVTKPGGFIFITSDFFRDEPHALTSPSLGCQHNRFYEHNALGKILDVVGHAVRPVGGADAPDSMPQGLRYRGDFVNGHSFVTFCLQKGRSTGSW